MTADEPRDGALGVVVADDHALFRSGLVELLEERGIDVLGQAADGDGAVRQAVALRPQVVLMDLNMPRRNGVEATRMLASAAPDVAVLVLTVSVAEADVLDALVAGAAGYVLKDSPVETIVEGVHAAARGDSVIAPSVARRLVTRVRQDAERRPAPSATVPLSDREVEVLRLMARGEANPEIAAALHITTNTVKNHISTILRKLGVDNRIEAAVYAVEHRLL